MALGTNLSKSATTEHPPKELGEKNPNEKSDKEVKKPSTQEAVIEGEEEKSNVTYDQYCVFSAGNEEYAISINLVREVVPYPPLAFIPQMPGYIQGMTNVRGNIYGVLDLNSFFKKKVAQDVDHKYLLVIDHDLYQMAIAIPEVPNTLMVSEDMIEKLSSSRLKSAIGQKYLKGIIKKDGRMIILLDILGMISSDKFTVVT
ncbi:chemotaxis protein CheW [Ekhidna sp.]|uniref:chemotaxis protein CheW n=1 Tax=Ekhidna sp. TaxID=2608089 RepID=UPI003CCC42B1